MYKKGESLTEVNTTTFSKVGATNIQQIIGIKTKTLKNRYIINGNI